MALFAKPTSSLREKFARDIGRRLVAFFAILVVVVGATLMSFLWQQRLTQVRSLLRAEEQRLVSEVEQIRESAERIAHSLPSGFFVDAKGPYEYVDEFTRELEMYGMDLGWIISLQNDRAQPWVDGRRRVVLSSPTNDVSADVASDLTRRPWPQENEGSGRSYQFTMKGREKQIVFLEAFPIYVGPSRVGFVLVGRIFSSDSVLAETLRRQVSASGGMVAGLGVSYAGVEIFRTDPIELGFFHETVESVTAEKSENVLQLRLRAYVQTKDLWLTMATVLLVSLVGFVIGLAVIGAWTRRAVTVSLEPLQSFLAGTSLLATGDFSVRVKEPEEEELFSLAQKFNFLASTLEQTMDKLATTARREEELRRRAVEAEIIQLRAQLQPHFLFNSLNMVAQTVLDNPKRAYEMTLALAELYRSILQASDKLSHSLEEELALVESYLRIQKMRFEQRLNYEMPSVPANFSLQIPCLALQNLVENALKHGIAPALSGGRITIRLEILSDRKQIIVENDGVPLPDNLQEGTGLKNTRRRWSLLHGDDARLDLDVTAEGKIRSILSVALETGVSS